MEFEHLPNWKEVLPVSNAKIIDSHDRRIKFQQQFPLLFQPADLIHYKDQ